MAGAMRFSDDFLSELKSRIRLSEVVGRKVRLTRRGKDFVGLSPFSTEKTPSFYVHDDRGFYKCFSTQKSGDVITFVMETDRLTFAEAVERLAHEAGLELPRQTNQDQGQMVRRATLLDWLEKAAAWFETQLRSPAGAAARAYLEGRGFAREAWGRHRMGFAPPGWRNLADTLVREGASPRDLVEAGLLVEGEEGKAPYDRFRNRVIFPICDTQGRVIAFGARTLDPDGKPKYLNSSDSPLFHKGKTLYRYMQAREALARTQAAGPLARGLVVTEGYVDAIALAEIGVGTAVAPLGTALTEDQIELLWRAGPEPILCFEGDAAGIRAAYRSVDRALPMIEPGRTLYFALLPDGLDPDDMIRSRGAEAMRERLTAARPLADLLWRRELDAGPLDTPERRAGLEARLQAATELIRHVGVRKAYEREMRGRLFEHFRTARTSRPEGAVRNGGGGSSRSPSQSDGRVTGPARQGILSGPARLAGLGLLVRAIDTPALLGPSREALCAADFPNPDVASIRDAVFDVLDSGETLDRRAVAAHLRNLGRSRSEKLLEEYPNLGSLDLEKGEGREWFSALERFPAAAAVNEAARAVIQEVSGDDMFRHASHLARLRAMIAEREQTRRPTAEQSQGGASEGASEIWSALDGLDGEMKRRFPKD